MGRQMARVVLLMIRKPEDDGKEEGRQAGLSPLLGL